MKTLFLQLQDELKAEKNSILIDIEYEEDKQKKQNLWQKFRDVDQKLKKVENFLTANYR